MPLRSVAFLTVFASTVALFPEAASACRAFGRYERFGYASGDFEAKVEATKIYERQSRGFGDQTPEFAFEARVIAIIRGNATPTTVKILHKGPCTGLPTLGQQFVVMGCIRALEASTATIYVFGRPGLYIPPEKLSRDCPPI